MRAVADQHPELIFRQAIDPTVGFQGYQARALAFATGYLRIAADKHWTTDVMTGAAVGSILGYVWPRYVDRWIGKAISVSPNGVALTAHF